MLDKNVRVAATRRQATKRTATLEDEGEVGLAARSRGAILMGYPPLPLAGIHELKLFVSSKRLMDQARSKLGDVEHDRVYPDPDWESRRTGPTGGRQSSSGTPQPDTAAMSLAVAAHRAWRSVVST